MKPSRNDRSALSNVTPVKLKVPQYAFRTSTMNSFGSPRNSPSVSFSRPGACLKNLATVLASSGSGNRPISCMYASPFFGDLLKCSAQDMSRRLTSRLRRSRCARCTPPGMPLAASAPPSTALHTSFASKEAPEPTPLAPEPTPLGAVKSTSPSTRNPSTGGASALLSAIPPTIASSPSRHSKLVWPTPDPSRGNALLESKAQTSSKRFGRSRSQS